MSFLLEIQVSLCSKMSHIDLDEQFRQILYFIKELISDVNDQAQWEKYRVWLEKLSDADVKDKFSRNKYLFALAEQIRDNVIEYPFTQPPPAGPLRSIESGGSIEADEATIWGSFKPIKPRRRIKKPFQQLGRNLIQAASWVEETSESADEEPDVSPEKKESLPFDETKFLQPEEAIASEEQLDVLKLRVKDLSEVKRALRDAQCLTENRKKSVIELQEKFLNLEAESIELRTKLEEQEKQFRDLDLIKTNELRDLKDKLSLVCNNEKEYLKQKDDLEKTYTSKMSTLEIETKIKMEELSRYYDNKLQSLKAKHGEELKEREDQIQKLHSELESMRTIPLQKKDSQISALKKSVTKLEKAREISEVEHVKTIEKLKHELQLQEMASQVKLQSQRADIVLSTCNTQQEELNVALDELEDKYKNLMKTIQNEALSTKQKDEELIEELRNILLSNNISV